jgi:hypothetical protein
MRFSTSQTAEMQSSTETWRCWRTPPKNIPYLALVGVLRRRLQRHLTSRTTHSCQLKCHRSSRLLQAKASENDFDLPVRKLRRRTSAESSARPPFRPERPPQHTHRRSHRVGSPPGRQTLALQPWFHQPRPGLWVPGK